MDQTSHSFFFHCHITYSKVTTKGQDRTDIKGQQRLEVLIQPTPTLTVTLICSRCRETYRGAIFFHGSRSLWWAVHSIALKQRQREREKIHHRD